MMRRSDYNSWACDHIGTHLDLGRSRRPRLAHRVSAMHVERLRYCQQGREVLLVDVGGSVGDRCWVLMLMIGVTRDLTIKLLSPRGSSGRRCRCGGSRAGAVGQTGGTSGVNSGGERDGGENQPGGQGRDGNLFADNGKAEDP